MAAKHMNNASTNVPTMSATTFSPNADDHRDSVPPTFELLKRFVGMGSSELSRN